VFAAWTLLLGQQELSLYENFSYPKCSLLSDSAQQKTSQTTDKNKSCCCRCLSAVQ